MTRVLSILAASAVLGLAGCGGGDDDSDDVAGSGETTATQASKPEGGADSGGGTKGARGGSGSVIEVNDSEFGQILTDGDGRALYLFDKETTDRSQCFGACEAAWPVFFTDGEPKAGKGVDQSLLGTTDHEGKTQVTYNGHPLYYYVDDGPGEVGCHNVEEFGGLWLVVDPGGNAIQ
jgi:predicted lipoprotein with Yx(FWY)xxD motif